MIRLLALLLVLSMPAMSQQIQPLASPGGTAGAGFVGPIDVVGSPIGWWGIRAGTAALRGTKLIRLERDTGGTQQDINSVSSTGLVDIAAALSFAGTFATCTGTISGTTLTTTSCSPSGTAQVGQTITGAGINQPSYIASGTPTCGASGGGTCTLNASQTVGSPETITITSAMTIVTWYDQSGNSRDATSGHTAATDLLPNCGAAFNNQPCVWFVNRASDPSTASFAVPAQPYTMSAVALKASGSAAAGVWGASNGANFKGPGFGATNLANIIWTSTVTATASDGSSHALQYVINTSSSAIAVDATQTTSLNTGTALTLGTAIINLGSLFGSGRLGCVNCYMNELGFWGVAFTGTQMTNMCHNQFAFWGTSTSC